MPSGGSRTVVSILIKLRRSWRRSCRICGRSSANRALGKTRRVRRELKDLENQFFGSQLAEIEEKTGIAERRILENQKQRDELDAARASAEARQAEIEANQPKERKELVKIKEAIRSLAERRSLLQKDLGRLEAQMEMAAAPKARGGHSGDQLLDLVRKMKVELERALEEIRVSCTRRLREFSKRLIPRSVNTRGSVGSSEWFAARVRKGDGRF